MESNRVMNEALQEKKHCTTTKLVAFVVFAGAVVDSRILKEYGEENANGSLAGDAITAFVSVVLIVVAIFGCVGVIRENVKILSLYTGAILMLLILELMVGIFVGVERGGLQIRVTDWLRTDFFKNTTGEGLTRHNEVWDKLQTYYECCGLNGPEDYPALKQKISLSCCPRAYRATTPAAQQLLYKACISDETYFSDGCEEEILYQIQNDADWLMTFTFVCFWFEVGGLLMAMYVSSVIKRSVKMYEETVKY